MEIPEIATDRLILEPLTARHATRLYPDISDQRIYQYIDESPPTSLAALRKRYKSLEARRSPDGSQFWLNWVLKKSSGDAYVGYVQATVQGDEAIIAYVLLPRMWGLGYAYEAVRAMLHFLSSECRVRRFIADVDRRNTRSIKLLQRVGFVKTQQKRKSTDDAIKFIYVPKEAT